ncbi:MAG: helix-turn-helix domain-containing protein [Solirubrobacterales bacterium]
MIKALAHPTRVDILNILAEGPSSPSRIARQLDNVSLNLTAHHIKVLRDLDCVELEEEVRHGGRTEHIYRLSKRPMFTAEEWDEVDPRDGQPITLQLLRVVSEELQEALLTGGFEGGDKHLSRTPLNVDEQGWGEVNEILKRALYELIEVADQSAERVRLSGDETKRMRVVILQFLLDQETAGADGV